MRRPSRLVALLVLAALLVAAGGAAPVVAGSGERLLGYQGGGRPMIVSVSPGGAVGEVRVVFAGANLGPGAAYRLTGSTLACTATETALSRTFLVNLGTAAADRLLLRQRGLGSTAVAPFPATKSIRLVNVAAPTTVVSCTAPAWGDAAPDSPDADLYATLGRHSGPAIDGLSLVIHGDRALGFTAILRGLKPGSTSRLVATVRAGSGCPASPIGAGAILARHRIVADARGTVALDYTSDVTQSDARDGEVHCHAILKGAATGTVRDAVRASRRLLVH
ncbi:MAG: hypothetical protein ACKOTZ_12135 [Chloroflexota bacterium]